MIQTHTGGDWVKTRQRDLTSTGIRMRMEEDNLDGGHNSEFFGWIAIPAGTGVMGGLAYEAVATPDAVTHNPYPVTWTQTFGAAPALFGNMHTYDGPDPAHLRQDTPVTRTGCSVFVEEETCTDAELAHTTEVVGLLAVQKGSIGSGVIVEVGAASADLTKIKITMTGSYSKCSSSLGVFSQSLMEAAAHREADHHRRHPDHQRPRGDGRPDHVPPAPLVRPP